MQDPPKGHIIVLHISQGFLPLRGVIYATEPIVGVFHTVNGLYANVGTPHWASLLFWVE
jgi:hypothetical protein